MDSLTYWMNRKLSPAAIAAAGWSRGRKLPIGYAWTHASGWTLEHCGHPTAIHPYALRSPAGELVFTGAAHATNPDPANGVGWPSLASAMMFVTNLSME